VIDPGDSPPSSVSLVEPPPPNAPGLFGSAFATAERYVGLLAGAGIERGLIGPREGSRLWSRHVLNSAALAALIPARAEVVDIGSGAGLPGIPLLLARPDIAMTLLEPMARRAAFLDEVVQILGIPARVVRGRAEEFSAASVDIAVARAVAPLAKLAAWSLPLLRPGGRLLALKGASATAEIDDAASVLKLWPLATVSLVTVPVGAETATVVNLALDGGQSTEQDRER